MSTPLIRLLKKERHSLNEWIRITEEKEYRALLEWWWVRANEGIAPRFLTRPHTPTRLQLLY